MQYPQIESADSQNYHELIELWEKSVRATHHFLSEADIRQYKRLIFEQYFDQLQLFCIKTDNKIDGFIGIAGKLIQMLFVDPKVRGRGVGKTLIQFGIHNHFVNEVGVNEQNEQAVGFYKHLGFQIVERFEEDAAGKPYPILSMHLANQLFFLSFCYLCYIF